MKSVKLSGLLKQEIRRLRKLNEEALAMVSAQKCAKPMSGAQTLICHGGRSASNYCKPLAHGSHDADGDEGGLSGKAVNFHVSGTFKYNKEGEPNDEDMTITSMQIMSGCDDYKPKPAGQNEGLSSSSVKGPGAEIAIEDA